MTINKDFKLLRHYACKLRDIRMAQDTILDKYLGEGEGQFHRVGTWPCQKSPVGICIYNPALDRAWDNCIFCHKPHGRR